MAQGLETDLKELLLSNQSFGPATIQQMVNAMAEGITNYRLLREAVQELEHRPDLTPATKTRLGVGYYLLGRYDRAIETLKAGDGGAVALFYLGKSHLAREAYDEAVAKFEAAASAGYDSSVCTLARVETLRLKGDVPGALAMLDRLSGAIEQTAEYLYQRGATVAASGQIRARPSPSSSGRSTSIRSTPAPCLAWRSKTIATATTTRPSICTSGRASRFPPHIGSLLNLGVLYEDRNQFDRAFQCYQRVLDVYPDHPRARLYFKDVEASGDMLYDEDAQRKRDRLSQVLGDPGHRFRAFGPQPQLPAADGHHDARRSLDQHRARIAGQQEFRRDVAGRNQGDAGLEGLAAGPARRRKAPRRAGLRARKR